MKLLKPTKITGAAILALTLSLSPIAGLVTGSAPSAFAAVAEKKTSTTWELDLKHAPFKKNGTLMVPIKEFTEVMDLRITPSIDKKFVYISSPTQSIRIKPGQSKAINAKGTTFALEAAPIVRHGMTYVPASLLAKGFGIQVKLKNKSVVTIQNSVRKHMSTAAGNMIFWLNLETQQLSMGEVGTLPKAAGKINLKDADWMTLKARKINTLSYVFEINNWHGEPHVFENHVRTLIHKGKIVNQGLTQFANFSGQNNKPDVNGYKGNVVIMDGSNLQLVHPTGKVVKTYDLAVITGVDDDFRVEAIEKDFILVRPYTKSTLFIVHPTSKKSELIYPNLLEENMQKKIEELPTNEAGYSGDGLTYNGYKNQELTFTFSYPLLGSSKEQTFTYKLPF